MQQPFFWSMFNTCASALEPMARNVARANLEITSLAGQRATAYMAIPQTLAQCRTPFDLIKAQTAFWQEAGRQYASATQRLMATWQAALPFDPARAGAEAEARDYITFPEPRPDVAAEDRRRAGEARRAAA
jgi:hypothetical protein